MPDHTWRHRHVNVENKKRAQEGKEPFPKYKGKGWDQKSQDDGSWQPSDVDYEQMEKDLGKEGQLTWPKPKIHPDDQAPEDKYKRRNALTIQKLFQQAQLGRTTLQIVKSAGSVLSKGAGSALSLLIGTPDRL